MIVEKHANGKIQLILKPESEIDALFVCMILKRANKGQRVEVSGDTQEAMVISVDEK